MHVVKQQSHRLALFQIWVMRLVETSREPKISILISTFQWVYNQIHHRYQINASCVVISHQGKKRKGSHLLTCIHTYNHHSNSFSVVLSALCHQSFAFQHLTAQTSGALSTQNTQAAACRLWLCLANSRACFPYVFYEGHQATVVSPQNVGLEASSEPLQYYANLVWLRAALVEYWEERSRCTRRRCHWGSADVTVTEKQVKKICKPRLVKSSEGLLPVR